MKNMNEIEKSLPQTEASLEKYEGKLVRYALDEEDYIYDGARFHERTKKVYYQLNDGGACRWATSPGFIFPVTDIAIKTNSSPTGYVDEYGHFCFLTGHEDDFCLVLLSSK